MRLDETKVFLFTFKTDQGDVQFPMRADTAQEAADKMQKTLQRMTVELSMDFPKVAAQKEEAKEPTQTKSISSGVIPPEVLEMRIDTLLLDMGAGELKGKAKAETVKLWSGLDFKEENYTGIITELEMIKTGQKEVPVKKK